MAKRKSLYRCVEKIALESSAAKRGDVSFLRDIARNGIVARNMAALVLAVKRILQLHSEKVIRIVDVKDRFSTPTDGGWADLCLLGIFRDGPPVVWELQLIHRSMMLVRSELGAHSEYAEFRAATEIDARLKAQEEGQQKKVAKRIWI